MSKRHKRPPVNLQDFKDKLYKENAIPVIAGDRTFYIRPPELLSDAEYRAFLASDDEIKQAAMLMHDYDEFVAAGGSAMLIGLMIDEAEKTQSEEQGADLGEEEASSAS